MATTESRHLLSYDDYCQLPDDGNRYELIEGVLQVAPSPSGEHQYITLNLGAVFRDHVRRFRLGRVYPAPFDLRFAPRTTVQPDLLFVTTDRLELVDPGIISAPPDLVVEVSSPGTRHYDEHGKQEIYRRYRVPYYWRLYPARREVAALALVNDQYQVVTTACGAQPLQAPPFPELTINLGEIWE
jgi:Uma2 family endonuclease